MSVINFRRKEIIAKVVYYGPALSGKTTNVHQIHASLPPERRGDLANLPTKDDRTLFFDYVPIHLGNIGGFMTRFQIYTVPGQVMYASTRKIVLQAVDGVVFVADSSPAAMESNKESLADLRQNLQSYDKYLNAIPFVIQYNKRDLGDAVPLETLEQELNILGVPAFEAIAMNGQGVLDTLSRVCSLVLTHLKASIEGRLAQGKRDPSVIQRYNDEAIDDRQVVRELMSQIAEIRPDEVPASEIQILDDSEVDDFAAPDQIATAYMPIPKAPVPPEPRDDSELVTMQRMLPPEMMPGASTTALHGKELENTGTTARRPDSTVVDLEPEGEEGGERRGAEESKEGPASTSASQTVALSESPPTGAGAFIRTAPVALTGAGETVSIPPPPYPSDLEGASSTALPRAMVRPTPVVSGLSMPFVSEGAESPPHPTSSPRVQSLAPPPPPQPLPQAYPPAPAAPGSYPGSWPGNPPHAVLPAVAMPAHMTPSGPSSWPPPVRTNATIEVGEVKRQNNVLVIPLAVNDGRGGEPSTVTLKLKLDDMPSAAPAKLPVYLFYWLGGLTFLTLLAIVLSLL